MAFSWTEVITQGTDVEFGDLIEVRDNLDVLKDGCYAHDSGHDATHDSSHDATNYSSHDGTADSSEDASDYATHMSNHDSTHYGTHDSSHDATADSTHYTTHYTSALVGDQDAYNGTRYTEKSGHHSSVR